MGSSWVLVHVVVSLLVLLGSAAKDEHNIGQREMSFDTIMQEMQSPDTFVMQQEADLTDLIDPKEFVIEQEPDMLDTPRGRGSRPGAMSPRRRHPGFGPRSHPPVLDYHVQFPLGRPTSDNLEALCLHGDLRPRYPNSFFPSSGFGQQRRRASAVNNAEAWFGTCCKDNQTWGREVTLCCATQAWELSLETFCEEDSSVKDRLYHCCRQTGIERLLCFQNDAQNPSYEPTEALPVVPLPATFDFSFDRNTCHSTQQSVSGSRGTQPSTSQKSDINFPPGRPNEDNVEGLCRNQKLRPLFSLKCLPNTGYEMVARQAKMINRVEKGFKQCCKKKQDVVACAEHKWRAELNRFCSSKKGGKADHHCCRGISAGDRFHCFQSTSPDPQYNMTLSSEELAPKVCKARKIIKKVLPLDFPVQYILNECCALAPQNQNSCFFQKVEGTSNRMCSSRMRLASPSAARHKDPMEVPKCITDFVMDVITKSTKVSNQKKNKRCPI